MTGALGKARDVIAGAINERTGGYLGSEAWQPTADAILAALVEQMGLREWRTHRDFAMTCLVTDWQEEA